MLNVCRSQGLPGGLLIVWPLNEANCEGEPGDRRDNCQPHASALVLPLAVIRHNHQKRAEEVAERLSLQVPLDEVTRLQVLLPFLALSAGNHND